LAQANLAQAATFEEGPGANSENSEALRDNGVEADCLEPVTWAIIIYRRAPKLRRL